jgi:hypothetical protein
MIKLPDLNFVTFFTSPAQPDCFFLWWHLLWLVFWFDVETINFDFFYYILPFLRRAGSAIFQLCHGDQF